MRMFFFYTALNLSNFCEDIEKGKLFTYNVSVYGPKSEQIISGYSYGILVFAELYFFFFNV